MVPGKASVPEWLVFRSDMKPKDDRSKTSEQICPVCHSSIARKLWRVDSAQSAQHFVLREVDPERFEALASHIALLWGRDTCDVVKCENCGFCYSSPFIAGDERFYTLAYQRTGYPEWKWEHQRTYEAVEAMARPGQKLLEIGAGDGAFVRRISPALLGRDNIVCTEYSEYGRRQIEQHGITCVAADVRDANGGGIVGPFTYICLFQVLEHMDRLESLFPVLHSLMEVQGSLFIAVPNERHIEFIERNGALLDMPPNHVGRWNEQSFHEIGKRYGLIVQEIALEPSSWFASFKLYLAYVFLRKAQDPSTAANWLCRTPLKSERLKRAGIVLTKVLYAIFALPAGISMFGGELGMSRWVHLRKVG